MEDVDSTSPQHDFVQYGDSGEHGELDLNYGGLLPEEVEEQEPEASPLHRVPAAYEESPPPRSRHASQPRSSNKEAAVVAKEHRPISFLEWQKQTKHGDEREDPLKEGTARTSRHRDSSPRRREPEGSRHQETSRARSREDRRRHDPQPRPPRDSPRRRAPSSERRRPVSRPRVDERRVTIVPKYVDINHGIDRRPRLDRPARSARDRTRSPHAHRSLLPARADHPAAYERRREPEVARHTQHVPTRHAPEPAWPELHAPPSGRKVEDFVRPHLDRAPIRAPAYTWDAMQYDRASHSAYPAPAEYDYRHGQSEYREPVSRDASYRAPLYREAAYGDAGGAAQGREVGYRQPNYDYDEPAYRDYRSVDPPHSSYARADTAWDAPRFADPHHDAYPHGYSAPDDRWTERDLRQLPARGSPRLARADRGSPRLPRAERDPVGLSRSGSYPYSRQDRGHDYLPAQEAPRHAPRLAHEYAAPPLRSFRSGLHQGPRDNRDARPRSVSRHVEEYASAGGHLGDPYASRRPPPPPTTSRRPSPRGRSPRRRERSPARETHRHHEVTRPSHHEADRPSHRRSLDRGRRPSDRAEPAGRDALQLTSRSFAMEAAAAASRPASASEPAEPGQLDAADLPPPPVGDASKAAPLQAAKPSRASVLVRPDAATDSRPGMKEGGETSPVLDVQQGFLSEETPAPRDRPFQRGQTAQPPAESTAGKPRGKAGREGGSRKESERRSSREQAADGGKGKDAHKASAAAEGKHDRDSSGVKGQGEASSRHKEASDRPQEGDTVRIADAKAVRGKRDEAAKKVSSADKDERQKIKPSSGDKDTPKAGSAHASKVAKASPPAKARTSTSKDRPASVRKPDPKKAPRSPPKAKADVATDKSNKAAGKVGSRGVAVVEKQAGRKRRSSSAERSRSPKRNASSAAARKSGKESDRHESSSGGKEPPLPPPPARPSSAANDADLPPPPIRLNGVAESQQAGERAPDGGWPDQALPPPPPKPRSNDNNESTSSRANGDVNGHAQHDAKTAVLSKEDKPASKPDADAAGKDASAKGASAKGAAEKGVSGKGGTAKDVSAKDPSAKHDPAKVVSPKDAPAKDPSAKAASKKPERELSAGRTGHKASERSSDKGHIVARDSRKYGDRPPTGRSGQKRARSRSPQKPVEGSKAASSTKRQAKATDSKQGDGKHSALQNGTSERSKDADKESRKEWMYEEKGKTLGPVSKKRLHEMWQKFKTDSKSKAADYLRFPVWRDGSRRAKQQVRDILTV